MTWEVEFTNEFEEWWNELDENEQASIAASVSLLELAGPNLRHPHSSGINGSKHSHMRELRTQHEGRPYRTLYAFDPRRAARRMRLAGRSGRGCTGRRRMSP